MMSRLIALKQKISLNTAKKYLFNLNVNIMLLYLYFIIEMLFCSLRAGVYFKQSNALSVTGQDYGQSIILGSCSLLSVFFIIYLLVLIKNKVNKARIWALYYIALSLIMYLWQLSQSTQELMNMIEMINDARQKALGVLPHGLNFWEYMKSYYDMLYLNLNNIYQVILLSVNLYLVCYLQTSYAQKYFKNENQ